jgi:hypothetical protein
MDTSPTEEPVTTPVVAPIVAKPPAVLATQVPPPGDPVSVAGTPIQKDEGPEMVPAAGVALTVTVAATEQPVLAAV